MSIRIGQGIDFHRLKEGLDLWVGGVKIPSEKGCVAHSDGDVLLHAICDAMLGAAGIRDIGNYFPDSSEELKNIRSTVLLERTFIIIREKIRRDLENQKRTKYITFRWRGTRLKPRSSAIRSADR